jgi:DNA-binding response OmpR family regulator
MRILVVEDETGLANSLVAALNEECSAVDIASDGEVTRSRAWPVQRTIS